jgi:hypothetical protein
MDPTRPPATYHEHLITVAPGDGSNYRIACSCGWSVRLASRSDLDATETALLHVRMAQPPSIEALFDRL